ncbi:hypothetical protein JCM8097_000949 [Rhodosporidiobolus ruineniae]
MLDRLPVELVRLVLDHLAPLDYTRERYKDRRSDLRSCCLINRTLRPLAQPLLVEVFEVRTEKDASQLATADKGSRVKLLVLVGTEEDPLSDSVDLVTAVASCPCISELRILEAGEFELDWLNSLPRLQHFIVVGCELVRPSQSSTFPSLLEISICGASLPDAFFDFLPTKSSTPALRALGLASLSRLDDDICPPFGWPSLNQQLDVYSLDACDTLEHEVKQLLDPALTLLDFCLGYNLPSNPPTAKAPTRLTDQQLQDAVNDMLKLLREKDVEVVWEKQANWSYESLISPAFWHRRREHRARAAKDVGES